MQELTLARRIAIQPVADLFNAWVLHLRHQQDRKALGKVLKLDDHILRDIGIDRSTVAGALKNPEKFEKLRRR